MADYPVGPADTFLQDGEMQRVELEGKPVVVARVDGRYYAIGGKCSHYGAPLQDGVLRGHTVMCPWHHACFDVRSGTRLEPPALNDVARYPVSVIDGQVTVTFPQENVTTPGGKADPANDQTFVIVGGGAAGGAAAEQLRRTGFSGKIIMISSVPNTPVDRPNLSKDYLDGHAKPEWIPLRGESFYAERDIEMRLNTQVTRIDSAAHVVHLNNGESLSYSKLLLATGATPRQLKNTPGFDLKNIHTLRSLADADAIIGGLTGEKRVVVIGASFIGLEVAAALASGRGASVSVVAPESVPFEPILGAEIGRMFQKQHEANGVQFYLGDTVAAFKGDGGTVQRVELKSGRVLDADMVVVGIGVAPATEFLNDSGLTLDDKDHSVRVNPQLQASAPDIYAAGDIARWEADSTSTRIEHWRVAQQHGVIAANNMVGQADSVDHHVPFFWTSQWGMTLNYVGHASSWDEIIYWGGSPEQKKFIAFFFSGGNLKAAASCDWAYDAEMDAIEFILREGRSLTPAQIKAEGFSPTAFLAAQS